MDVNMKKSLLVLQKVKDQMKSISDQDRPQYHTKLSNNHKSNHYKPRRTSSLNPSDIRPKRNNMTSSSQQQQNILPRRSSSLNKEGKKISRSISVRQEKKSFRKIISRSSSLKYDNKSKRMNVKNLKTGSPAVDAGAHPHEESAF